MAWDFIIIATTFVVALYFFFTKLEIYQKGLRWLAISLCSCGTLVYFREQWIALPWLTHNGMWEWGVSSVDYYSIIALSATIYILVLSFRNSRLIERTNMEEDQALNIMRDLDSLERRLEEFGYNSVGNQVILSAIITNLENLDKAARTRELYYVNRIFTYLFSIIRDNIEEIKSRDKSSYNLIFEQIHNINYDLLLLYRSKQRGKYPAEVIVLFIFTFCTIFITMGTRPSGVLEPEFSDWNKFIIDVVAFLFSSATCFLAIDLVNLRDYRATSTFRLLEKEAENRGPIQAVFLVVLALLVPLMYMVLLYDKWISRSLGG